MELSKMEKVLFSVVFSFFFSIVLFPIKIALKIIIPIAAWIIKAFGLFYMLLVTIFALWLQYEYKIELSWSTMYILFAMIAALSFVRYIEKSQRSKRIREELLYLNESQSE